MKNDTSKTIEKRYLLLKKIILIFRNLTLFWVMLFGLGTSFDEGLNRIKFISNIIASN